MNDTMARTQRRRPLGVTVISVLEFLQGILLVVFGIIGFVGAGVIQSQHVSVNSPVVGIAASTVLYVTASASLLIGLFSLLFAWGLWTLRRWAFWLTIVFQVLSILNSISQLTQPGASIGSSIGGMIIPVVLLLYFLVDANVRAAFRK